MTLHKDAADPTAMLQLYQRIDLTINHCKTFCDTCRIYQCLLLPSWYAIAMKHLRLKLQLLGLIVWLYLVWHPESQEAAGRLSCSRARLDTTKVCKDRKPVCCHVQA